MRRLHAVRCGAFVLLAHLYIMAVTGLEVLAPVFPAAQASLCIPSSGQNCAISGVHTHRSPIFDTADQVRDHQLANISHQGFHSPAEERGIMFGPQRPRLAARLYHIIKSKELFLFGAAVLGTVLVIRMLVVPGQVWGQVWGLGRHVTNMLFWTLVLVTAAPAAVALCFISGASFIMIGATMLALLLR